MGCNYFCVINLSVYVTLEGNSVEYFCIGIIDSWCQTDTDLNSIETISANESIIVKLVILLNITMTS